LLASENSSTTAMDRQHPPPFPRPPERTLIHNPNHQNPQTSQTSQSYTSYPPPASQPQPALHVPFASGPYPPSRRDPFLPSAAQHVRRGSYGLHGAEGALPGPPERHGGWGNTGTNCSCGSSLLRQHSAVVRQASCDCLGYRSMSWKQVAPTHVGPTIAGREDATGSEDGSRTNS
jgi:hypothetical protein